MSSCGKFVFTEAAVVVVVTVDLGIAVCSIDRFEFFITFHVEC